MSVVEPDVIDAISLDQDGRAILAAAEGRPLRDDPVQLEQISAKIATYLGVAADGQVPELAGRVLELQLFVPNEPRTPQARALLGELYQRCVAAGHGFCLVVQRPSDVLAEVLGLGAEEHRPYDSELDGELPFPVQRLQGTDEQDTATLEAARPDAQSTSQAQADRSSAIRRRLAGD